MSIITYNTKKYEKEILHNFFHIICDYTSIITWNIKNYEKRKRNIATSPCGLVLLLKSKINRLKFDVSILV